MIELRVVAGLDAAAGLTQVKLIATRFPGEHELMIVVPTETCRRCGGKRFARGTEREMETIMQVRACRCSGAWTPEERRLKLGPEWWYDASPACLAALAEFGVATVR